MLAVNLSGTFYLTKYGIPALVESGGGSIITTSSEYGLLGARRSAGYCAAKAGIINLTRALAVDHAPTISGPTASFLDPRQQRRDSSCSLPTMVSVLRRTG